MRRVVVTPATVSDDLVRRLDRLEEYLRQDARNPTLLADAFDVALAAGATARAEFHLRHAQALGLDPLDWLLREAHWLLAQQRWRDAGALLRQHESALAASPRHATTLAHDLAYVALRDGRAAEGIARLHPLIEGPGAQETDAAVETTWLRLLHQAGDLPRAMAWLQHREALGALRPGAAGIGSLVALDQGDYAACLRWSLASLADAGAPPEAMVARASLALAERDGTTARHLLAQALERNASDGRTWSALGFAELLDGRALPARQAFERATAAMPQHVGTWHGLGWAAIAQGDWPAARGAFDRALALDRNVAESHGGLAVAAALSGETEAARAAIARALGLDRQSLAARYAESLLAGEGSDAAAILRLAERLLGGRRAPLGGDVVGLLKDASAGRTGGRSR